MPPVQDRAPRYRAYMLRCWEARGERPGQPGAWRFSLECVETGQKRGFSDLAGLVAFLEEESKRGAAGCAVEPGRETSDYPVQRIKRKSSLRSDKSQSEKDGSR